ncbi:hypothetical protein [Agrobacterium tumefaciens]|uniref:hypothetical protein n=1 Tax=Agrobacterium tumefaciens TaxID=358 RepID=UPI001572BCB4|nr:hypothetical protein [Agrobacterium tumefaciens]
MTAKSAEYLAAVHFADERFNLACAEADALPVAGSMCSHDIARLALEAKEEAEREFGVFIVATLDRDWNWTFS